MVLRTAKCDSHPFLAYVGSVYAGFHGMMLKTLEKKKKDVQTNSLQEKSGLHTTSGRNSLPYLV